MSLGGGHLVARTDRAEQFVALKNMMALCYSVQMKHIVVVILTAGHRRKHLERVRPRIAKARDCLTPRSHDAGIGLEPHGGRMCRWARLAAHPAAMLRRTKSQGILLAPAEIFSSDARLLDCLTAQFRRA